MVYVLRTEMKFLERWKKNHARNEALSVETLDVTLMVTVSVLRVQVVALVVVRVMVRPTGITGITVVGDRRRRRRGSGV